MPSIGMRWPDFCSPKQHPDRPGQIAVAHAPRDAGSGQTGHEARHPTDQGGTRLHLPRPVEELGVARVLDVVAPGRGAPALDIPCDHRPGARIQELSAPG